MNPGVSARPAWSAELRRHGPALGGAVALGYPRDMREAGDETLMHAYAGGDMAAFDTLYARYRAPLYRYYLRQLGDAALANDLYQGCWEKVIKARERYRPTTPFKAWLFRIARNHLIDHYRAARGTADLDHEPVDPAPGPDESLDRAEADERLMAAVSALPEAQRETLLLRLEGGFDLHQIGDITGAGFETAKSRLRYATRKLKQVLKP